METGGSEAGPQSLDTGVNEGPRAGRAPGEAPPDSPGKGTRAEQGGAGVPRAGEVRLPVTCGRRCMSVGNWGAGTGVPRGRVRTQGGGENTGVRCHAERHESLGGEDGWEREEWGSLWRRRESSNFPRKEGHGTGRTRARATNLGPAGGRRGLGSGAGGRCTWLAAGQRGLRGGGSRTPVTGISASLRNCPDGETKPR